MSLINDALKKTQRMRSDPNDTGPVVAGGYAGGPRGRSNSGPSMFVMVGGGLLLVAVAILGTVLLLKSKSAPPSAATVAPTPAVAPVNAPTSEPLAAAPVSTTVPPAAVAPVIVAPVLTLAKVEPTPAPAAAVAKLPEPVAATTPPPATAINPAAKAKVDVSTFIDAIHVTGVRFTEGGSKVLMNDHVYKVNDVVERVLNIKLIEVGTDSLTFIDENGAVYKKNFEPRDDVPRRSTG